MAKDNTKATAARRHTMPTTIGGYENKLIEMIEERNGVFDPFLIPQVQAAAQCWMMLTKVHRDLMEQTTLTTLVPGSMGQVKNEVHPLLPYYLKLQAELRLQFEALGLNYKATPSKIKENTKKGGEEHDKLSGLLKDINNVQ